jgi:hypothetical protein
VVTPQGDGHLERSWLSYGERMASVRLASGELWEGPEEELGDGTVDPDQLSAS